MAVRTEEATRLHRVNPVGPSTISFDGIRPADSEGIAIIASASGATELVAAPGAGYCVLVQAYNVMKEGSSDVVVSFLSAATQVSGRIFLEGTVAKGKVVPFNPLGWFRTADNEALNINLSAAVDVEGEITYTIIRA
jgi:hypothetical protein